jgi:hypothetical protein
MRSDSSVVCLSDQHLKYMGIATLAILLYYPISTFMFPNFQFQDKSLDLKYDPSFLVLNIQAKLLITGTLLFPDIILSIKKGFISFFKPESEDDISIIIVRQVGVAMILFFLALITIYLRPCLIKRVNVWDVAFYALASWVKYFLSILSLILKGKFYCSGCSSHKKIINWIFDTIGRNYRHPWIHNIRLEEIL